MRPGEEVANAEDIGCIVDAACGDDRPIAERRRGGDLQEIATLHYARLLRFLRGRGRSADEAADLAQDAFVRMSSANIANIRDPGSFLFTTALNLLRDQARSAQTRYEAHSVPAEEAQLVCEAPLAERVLDAEQQLAVLEGALQELSPKCRAVFVMFRFDEISQGAIADRCGISVSMVEKYIKQAMNHCQKRLDEANAGLAGVGEPPA